MSVFYFIDTILDLAHTEENIKDILVRGKKAGFIYCCSGEYLSPFVSIEKMINTLLYADIEDYERCVYGKFQDTKFSIWLSKTDAGFLSFAIGGFCPRWYQDFAYGATHHMIDFARYARLMLNVCNNLPVIGVETFTDNIDIEYVDTNCITVATEFGSFTESCSGSMIGVRGGVDCMIDNGIIHDFIFFNDQAYTLLMAESPVQIIYDTLKAGFPAFLYAKVDDVPFKIEIKRKPNSYDFVSIYPLAPYKMKKGYGSEKEKIDLAFYVQRMIELCENFAIYELKTL